MSTAVTRFLAHLAPVASDPLYAGDDYVPPYGTALGHSSFTNHEDGESIEVSGLDRRSRPTT